jgi:hypothetical protein
MTAASLLRRVRRLFAGNSPASTARADGVCTGQMERFAIAQTTVRAFYAFALYFLAAAQFPDFNKLIDHPPLAPLWPVGWLNWVPTPNLGVRALLGFYAVATLAGLFWPGLRWARIGVWLGLLELVALENSSGKIGHSLHLMVFIAFALILLPAGWDRAAAFVNRRTRQSALLVLWLCQAVILLSYTMSGIGKLGGGIYQLAHGLPNAFSPGGLGAHVAERLLQTHSRSFFGDWIIDHPWLTWPAFPGAIYVELFSFWIAFRPALSRLWAGALITFHLGVFLSMTINFPQNCLLLALFFFQSPFQPGKVSWREALADLPMMSEAVKLQALARTKFAQRKAANRARAAGEESSGMPGKI